MKVVKAETILVSIPFESGGLPPWGWGGAPANTFDILLVRLETEDGLVGWGEAFSRMADVALKQLIDTRVLPLVVGRDSRQIARIKHDIEFNLHNFGRSGSIMYGISAVDIALWDIAAKRAGQPLCNLLGGPSATEVEVYASFVRYGTRLRLPPPWSGPSPRATAGSSCTKSTVPVIRPPARPPAGKAGIMLDMNCPWSVEQALAIDAEIANLGLYWFEEPVWPPENYRGLAEVRATGRHRIAAGENAGSLFDFVAMHDAGAIDIAQPDVAKAGGVTELVKIARFCEANGLTFSPHCAIFGPGQIATIHLTAAEVRPPLFERLYLDFEAEIFGNAGVVKGGKLKVPTAPGLGVDPDPEIIARYKVA